jgi:hypothetical protein
MAKELYFPPIGPDVSVNQEHKADNGVTYTWTPGYSAWMIGSSQQVNKDYVDSRDQLRLRLDGFNFMYGDLVIKDQADELEAITMASLSQEGILSLSNKKKIDFVGDGGTINVSDVPFLKFSNSEINVEKRLNYNKVLDSLSVYKGSKENVTIIDFDTTSKITSSIAISRNSQSYFSIRKSGSLFALFRVRSNGAVQIRSTEPDKPFTVLPGSDGLDDAFHVTKHGNVHVSKELNTRLLASDNAAVPMEDTTVATKGYVDSKSARAGYGVVANSEAEAEINGFWRNGNNLYLRVS